MALERTETGYRHWCAGCQRVHEVRTEADMLGAKPYVVAGSRDTICGEVLIDRPDGTRCRYRLAAGLIRFAPDCTHGLRGECVPLEAIPDGEI